MKLQINYLDKHGDVLASHVTPDEFCAEQVAEWSGWLNDANVEHPGAPEEWDSFQLIPQPISETENENYTLTPETVRATHAWSGITQQEINEIADILANEGWGGREEITAGVSIVAVEINKASDSDIDEAFLLGLRPGQN